MSLNQIARLDAHLVNKIAAGEVVERPGAVVKELFENSIDADANAIIVSIKDGGLSEICLNDNGIGIPEDQIVLAFAAHTTSKIRDLDDLESISTLGFRGEALASIAAVSQIEITTKIRGAEMGIKAEFYGGALVSKRPIACASGTSVCASGLFFNTPARLKFMKSPRVEAGRITDIMRRLALGYPKVAIRYIADDREIFSTKGADDELLCILSIYGTETAKRMIKVENELIKGYVGTPEAASGSRSAQNFFVNNRYIKSELLQNALESVYRERLPLGKFPVCVLRVNINPREVDVNVHPSKTEARFADERVIREAIIDAIKKALSSIDASRELPILSKPVFEYAPSKPKYAPSEKPKIQNSFILPQKQEPKKEESKESSKHELMTKPFEVLGFIFGTYWLVWRDSALYIIDQHAAHERILYEDFYKTALKGVAAQPLLEPEKAVLGSTLTAKALIFQEKLLSLGFQISSGEGDDYVILHTSPFALGEARPVSLFFEIMQIFENEEESEENTLLKSKDISERLARAACRVSVTAGQNLGTSAARLLIEKLFSLENPFSCPHGRPAIAKISKSEIESVFLRI